MSKFEGQLKTLIDVISEGFTKEVIEENQDVVLKVKSIYDADPKGFFDKLKSARLRLNTVIESVIEIPNQKNVYILEHIASGLYEHFFRQLMEKVEGPSCCADKSKYITRVSLKALKENKNLSLYEDYSKYEEIKEDKERQAYWSPKSIENTDKAMKLFWNWYLLRDCSYK